LINDTLKHEWNDACFFSFQLNLVVVLDFFTLPENIKFICTRETAEKLAKGLLFYLFLKPNIVAFPMMVLLVSETPNEQFFSYIMTRTSYIRWDYDVLFELDQHIFILLTH
jgi:hypothetical protein